MKATTCVGLVILILGGRLVLAEEGGRPSMRVRPIQMTSWDNVPPGLGLPMSASSYQPRGQQPGFQVSYLVEGQDIAGFHSLTIETIKTPEGVDISKYRNGRPAYEAGAFPSTSQDGKYCIFSLHVNQNQFGKVERLAIKGHATVLVGTKWEEKKIDLKATDKQATKVGAFSVRVMPGGGGIPFGMVIPGVPMVTPGVPVPGTPPPVLPRTSITPEGAEGDPAMSTPVPATPVTIPPNTIATPGGGQSDAPRPISVPLTPAGVAPNTCARPAEGGVRCILPYQTGGSASLGVEITGPLKGLTQVTFAEGDREMQSPGSTWSDNSKTYFVPKPQSGRLTLTLRYWVDLKEAKIPIGP